MNELVKPDDTRDALRALGALIFGTGVLVLSTRKSDPSGFVHNDGWGHVALLFLYLIPAVILYGGAIASVRQTGGLRPWQAIASVFGLLFVAPALSEFVHVIDGNPSASLNVAWIAAVVAGLAVYAGLFAGVRFQLLVGSLALFVAYLAVLNKILSDGVFSDFGTLRGILGIYAIVLLVAAVFVWRTQDDGLHKASELVTGAGIAAVLATVVISLTGPVAEGVSNLLSTFGGGADVNGAQASVLWDVLSLLVSLGLIMIGVLAGTRGPVYVGAIGLFLFAVIVGQDLDAASDDRENGVVGWPLILLILGGLAIVASMVREASLGDRPRQFIDNLRKG